MGTTDPPTVVDARADDALGDSDASDLRDRLARREVSPAELREAARARARLANPRLNAVTEWVDRAPPPDPSVPGPGQSGIGSALAGIPTALKDNEALAGYPMSNGSLAMPSTPSPQSSPIIGLLLDLGLEPIALTTLPEFGLTASTESTRYGATRNPWDLRRSAGGSSGGSAALVAAGVVPLAHANDGGGSTRIPAACCGLVGLKPSRGRLPDAPGTRVLPVQITAQGVLTRSVRDTALFYAAAEARRPVPGLRPIGQVTRPGRARLRIGVCTTASRDLPVSPDTVDAVQATARLCQDLGHDLVPVDPPVGDDFGPDFLVYWALLSALVSYGGPQLYGPGFDRSRVEEFTRGMSARLLRDPTRAIGAVRRLTRLAREHETAFAHYDVLLCPVTGHPAPVLGRLGPTTPFAEHLVRLMRFASMTPVQNVSGSPAISLPLGRSAEGQPIGVQLAAPFGFERRLLQLALALEEAAPWPTRPIPPDQAG